MALKLIALEDAARQIGVSVEELNRLREQREISGYRDGASWKFKEQDLERLKEKLAQTDEPEAASSDSGELFDLPIGMIQEDGETDDIVLLSDLEFGESGPGTSSTIIGRPGTQRPEESDIRIVSESEPKNAAGHSDLTLPVASSGSDSGSNLRLVVDEQFEVSTEADTQLRLDKRLLNPDAGVGLSGLGLGEENAPLIVDRASTSDISLSDDSNSEDLVLGSDLSLGSGDSKGSKGSKTGDSGIALATDELDDEMVLGGSDITLGTADSGISLASPSDSGLSLEEPLALRAKEPASLGLGGDEVSLIPLEDSGEASSDDDFLLTPMQDAEADEADSGSQVIALDSESSFGSDMLGGDAGMAAGMLEEDFGAAVDSADPLGSAASLDAPSLAPAGGAMSVTLPRESAYTTWNVVSLGACALILSLTGIMMLDLMRNIWSWDTPYSLNSTIMDTILGLFEG